MQEQSSWSFGFAALGSLSTAIYAVFFVFEFFLNRKGKNKTNGVPSAENGPAKGAASSISKFLFKSLTALFAALGALVTALFAFLSLAALSIHAIAPRWDCSIRQRMMIVFMSEQRSRTVHQRCFLWL